AGKVRRAAARDDNPATAAVDHPGQDRAAAEVDTEHVHLEHMPPLAGIHLPRLLLPDRDAGVRDEQVDGAELALDLRDHRLDRGMISALRVFGRDSTKRTRSGVNAFPSSRATAAAISRASSSPGSCPGSRQQKSHATSPLTSCGTPIAAASRTAGCPTAADSS